MGDPEVIVSDIEARLRAILAELRWKVSETIFPRPTYVRFGASTTVGWGGFGGWSQWDATQSDFKNPLTSPMFMAFGNTVWIAHEPLPEFSTGVGEGFVIGHAHDYEPGFVLQTPYTLFEASHGLQIVAGGVGNSYIWIFTRNGGDIQLQAAGNLLVEDGTYSQENLMEKIQEIGSTGHTHLEAHITDLDKYTQAQVDTIQSNLQSEIDSDIATHTAIASAHHAKYTDAEVDARIAIHTAIASAHHAKYTDAEAVSAMGVKGDANPLHHDKYTLETHETTHRSGGGDPLNHDNLAGFVANEHLLPAAIDHDSLLNFVANEHLLPAAIDHNALLNYVANRHKLESEMSLANLGSRLLNDLSDTGITGAAMRDGLTHGAGNEGWFPCVIHPGNTNNIVQGSGVWFYRPSSTGQTNWTFVCVAPTRKGDLKFYVNGWEIGIWDADAGDYLDRVRVHGQTWSAQTTVDDDTTNYTGAQRAFRSFTAVDMSSYNQVLIETTIQITTITDFELAYINLRGYYGS